MQNSISVAQIIIFCCYLSTSGNIYRLKMFYNCLISFCFSFSFLVSYRPFDFWYVYYFFKICKSEKNVYDRSFIIQIRSLTERDECTDIIFFSSLFIIYLSLQTRFILTIILDTSGNLTLLHINIIDFHGNIITMPWW